MSEAPIPLRRRGRPAALGAEPGGEVQSLDRAIMILGVLATADGMSLSEIARKAELPTSTVHRLLATLQRRGLVGHDASNGSWTVGVELFRIGSAYLRIRKLPDVGRGVIRDLGREVDETINLSMLDGRELVCVAQVESHAAVRAFFRLGRRLPMHASAAGKSILAASNPELRREHLSGLVLDQFTKNTLLSKKALLTQLDEIGARGWAIDDEEHTLGMRCVAAAVFNEWGEPIGALSVSAPTVRMPPERIATLGPTAKAAADQLTTLFSGSPPPP